MTCTKGKKFSINVSGVVTERENRQKKILEEMLAKSLPNSSKKDTNNQQSTHQEISEHPQQHKYKENHTQKHSVTVDKLKDKRNKS